MVASLRSVSRFWTNNQRIVFFLSGGLHLCLSMNTWSCQMLAPIIFPTITGSCPNNSKELNDANLNFIKTHPLMNDAVPPFFNHPVLIRTGLNMAFTSIAVDPQVFQDGVTLIRHHLFFRWPPLTAQSLMWSLWGPRAGSCWRRSTLWRPRASPAPGRWS